MLRQHDIMLVCLHLSCCVHATSISQLVFLCKMWILDYLRLPKGHVDSLSTRKAEGTTARAARLPKKASRACAHSFFSERGSAWSLTRRTPRKHDRTSTGAEHLSLAPTLSISFSL